MSQGGILRMQQWSIIDEAIALVQRGVLAINNGEYGNEVEQTT